MTNNLSFDAEQRRLQGAWFTENLASNHGYAGAAYRIPPSQPDIESGTRNTECGGPPVRGGASDPMAPARQSRALFPDMLYKLLAAICRKA